MGQFVGGQSTGCDSVLVFARGAEGGAEVICDEIFSPRLESLGGGLS